MRMVSVLVLLCLFTSGLSAPARAHEFWLDPENYQVPVGGRLVADLRNGQKFKGMALSFLERDIARFDIVDADGVRAVTGRTGDIPALDNDAGPEGLVVLVHQTTPSSLRYKTWEKFQAFADHKDFPDIRARHMARGLPEAGFKESYTRYVKSLVAVGDGHGADAPVGLETEFVALDNPYEGKPSALRFLLLYQQQPRADAQVEMFDRAPDGSVRITLHRTDADGRVSLPVTGGHVYLLDAVVLREMPPGTEAVWESLWAAMTFAVP